LFFQSCPNIIQYCKFGKINWHALGAVQLLKVWRELAKTIFVLNCAWPDLFGWMRQTQNGARFFSRRTTEDATRKQELQPWIEKAQAKLQNKTP
jgi:hypothetical protein